MTVPLRTICGVALGFVLACATPPPQRTIEPTTGGGGDAASDDDFVRERAPTKQGDMVIEYPIHVDGSWYAFRAKSLNKTEAETRARDVAMSQTEAPVQIWDEVTAVEAVSIWSALCNECHGGRRRVRDAVVMPPPPAGWGVGEGLFFGARRPYREVFGVIWTGGPMRNGQHSEMPSWSDKLSREQIWSIIYFLEYQSGGTEGRFPPSLYPRGPSSAE